MKQATEQSSHVLEKTSKGETLMPQTITNADLRRGWIDCNTCGDTLRIFYHHRCPTCHTQFTVPETPSTQREGSETLGGAGLEKEST
jgi:uncharacterized paraquat-inducible protein A